MTLADQTRYELARALRGMRMIAFSLAMLAFAATAYVAAWSDICSLKHLHYAYAEALAVEMLFFAQFTSILFSFDSAQSDRQFGLGLAWKEPICALLSKSAVPALAYSLAIVSISSIVVYWSSASGFPISSWACVCALGMLVLFSSNGLVLLVSYLSRRRRNSLACSLFFLFIAIEFMPIWPSFTRGVPLSPYEASCALAMGNAALPSLVGACAVLLVPIALAANYKEIAKWLNSY